MVESGHGRITQVDFESRLHTRLPVEVIDRSELVARVDPGYFIVPQRPSFFIFLLMHSSHGSHTVDFTEIPAQPRRLVQVRPGQVQVWNTGVDFDATLVLAQPTTTSPRPWFPGHRSYCDLDDTAAATAAALIGALRGEQNRFAGDQPTRQLLISLFDAFTALFDRAIVGPAETNLPQVYVAFRDAIETDLGHRHDVIDYARLLGYSARTITRACEQVTGQSAKRILTDRLVLEAKRLLVHSRIPAGMISARLGFSEPTNFTKFFTRNTGQSPSSFRRLHRHGY